MVDCYTALVWCLVAIGLSEEYETWHPIGWHCAFVIGWSKYRLGSTSASLHYGTPFFRPQWQSLCTALMAGICLPLGLCKGTVKESTAMAKMEQHLKSQPSRPQKQSFLSRKFTKSRHLQNVHYFVQASTGQTPCCQETEWTYEQLRKETQVNSSPPGQNSRHFADDIFKCIFMNEKFDSNFTAVCSYGSNWQ